MKDTKRALRRHHRQRMIARARRVMWYLAFNDTERHEWARRNHDHMKVCSCWMCGNPRKREGPTTQERRQSQRTPEDDRAPRNYTVGN